MKGSLIINGKDAYTSYGAIALKGGVASLIGFPPSKPVEFNDWYEENGIEADLSSLKLEKHTFSMPFAFVSGETKMNSFITELRSKPHSVLNFANIGLQKTLRFIGVSDVNYAEGLMKCSVRFCEDSSPLEGRTFSAFNSSVVGADTSFKLDNVLLSKYGVSMLKGTYNSIMRQGETKTALERNLDTLDGVLYDSGAISKVKSSDVTLQCLLRAGSKTEAWNNYYGLLQTLIAPKSTNPLTEECIRTLYVKGKMDNVRCYYKSSSVSDFSFDGNSVWIKFSLTLVRV